MQFAIDRTSVGDRPALVVRGELDLENVPTLAQAVEVRLAERPRALVIDLTPATFLDSSGARQLAVTARAARRDGVTLHVICPRSNRAARLPIDVLDLHSVLSVVESAAEIDSAFQGEQAGP